MGKKIGHEHLNTHDIYFCIFNLDIQPFLNFFKLILGHQRSTYTQLCSVNLMQDDMQMWGLRRGGVVRPQIPLVLGEAKCAHWCRDVVMYDTRQVARHI